MSKQAALYREIGERIKRLQAFVFGEIHMSDDEVEAACARIDQVLPAALPTHSNKKKGNRCAE